MFILHPVLPCEPSVVAVLRAGPVVGALLTEYMFRSPLRGLLWVRLDDFYVGMRS